jgi:hypothetical protein
MNIKDDTVKEELASVSWCELSNLCGFSEDFIKKELGLSLAEKGEALPENLDMDSLRKIMLTYIDHKLL